MPFQVVFVLPVREMEFFSAWRILFSSNGYLIGTELDGV